MLKFAQYLQKSYLFIGLFVFYFTQPASAQKLCGPLDQLLKNFENAHGEIPIWIGESNSHKTILLAKGDGSWSVLMIPRVKGGAGLFGCRWQKEQCGSGDLI